MGEGYADISVQSLNSIENTSAVKIEKIGDLTPVQDFETLMSRRDGPEWIGKAIKDMKNKIFDLVEDSYEGDNYPKALECLVALRKGCILEQVHPHPPSPPKPKGKKSKFFPQSICAPTQPNLIRSYSLVVEFNFF